MRFGNASLFISIKAAVSELLPPVALSEHSQYGGTRSLERVFQSQEIEALGLLHSVRRKTSMRSILAVTRPFLLLPSYETRCRQFVEMVNGTDSEVRCFSARSPRSQDSYPGSPSLSPRHGSSNSHVHSTGKCGFCACWQEE